MTQFFLHSQQAKLNEEAAIITAQSGINDWAVTMCFYSALHYVKAYAHYKGINLYLQYRTSATEHDRILDFVYDISYGNEDDRGKSISAYETLYDASMKSR